MVAGAALIQRHTVRLASRYTRAWSVRTSSVRPFVRARRRTSAMATADRRVRVAVVGGGAAGLAAAKELRAEGHTPVVFEQGTDVGGVWVYDPRVESDDVTGTDPSRAKVHGSMYASLRTNLPREVMGYPSFPFTKGVRRGRQAVLRPRRGPRLPRSLRGTPRVEWPHQHEHRGCQSGAHPGIQFGERLRRRRTPDGARGGGCTHVAWVVHRTRSKPTRSTRSSCATVTTPSREPRTTRALIPGRESRRTRTTTGHRTILSPVRRSWYLARWPAGRT